MFECKASNKMGFFFSSERDCEAIEVTATADPCNNQVGIYLPWNEETSEKSNNSVWKIQLGDRYIFNDGRDRSGYRIGSKSGLTTRRFYCKGKYTLTLFTISSTLIPEFTPI